ncbi:MAG TPA: cytochrome c peroxidase, partial [Polyangiaceae bacterium]
MRRRQSNRFSLDRGTLLKVAIVGAASFAFVPAARAQEAPEAPAPEVPEAPEPPVVEAPKPPVVVTPAPAAPVDPPPPVPASLSTVPVPQVAGIDQFIQDSAVVVALGKALFWDAAVGSDGLACASCHFHAGADNRTRNQVNPGILRQDGASSGQTFGATASGSPKAGPNYALRAGDFPFHQFVDPDNRQSAVRFTTDDVSSSQGTFGGTFTAQGLLFDACQRTPDATFNVKGIGTRKVEPRNTPTMINAVFNYRNFWDGRANNIFNGMNPFGARDTSRKILQVKADGTVGVVQVALPNSSLASQAAGPPLSSFEMSCQGRTFPDLGRKVISRNALSTQVVAADDSVLAPYRARLIGLSTTYADLIKRAFKPAWWNARGAFGGYSQMENNFSLFWGLAIQAYEATLISNQAPFDAWSDAGQPAAGVAGFRAAEIRGLTVFMGKGKCIDCHGGPEFTNAASQLRDGTHGLVEQMLMGDGGLAIYDDGFYNIGVTPAVNDPGVGGVDAIIGAPLSFSEQVKAALGGRSKVDSFDPGPIDSAAFGGAPIRTAVSGAFKVPSLRNVELTGPYMHNGSMATLEQVVQFYNRGGNFRNPDHDAEIAPIGLSAQERADLVAFLKSLT